MMSPLRIKALFSQVGKYYTLSISMKNEKLCLYLALNLNAIDFLKGEEILSLKCCFIIAPFKWTLNF